MEGTRNILEHPTAAARTTRWAIASIFLLNGIGFASWAAHIPYVKEKFGLDDAALGQALLAIAVGSVCALGLGGKVVARFGSRAIMVAGAFGFCVALPLLLVAPTFPLLILVLAFFGATIGVMEVSANVQAFGVEEWYGRPIMSSFHGMFSMGGLVGAALAGVLLSWNVNALTHMVCVALVLALITVVGMRSFLPTDPEAPQDAPTFVLPSGPLLGLGILGFFCLVAEGAMADWSAVYLRDSLGSTPSFGAAGYAAFSSTMAIGRFGGDALRARLHAKPLVRLSGVLAAAGLGMALVIGHPVVALLGFACVGLGLSNIVPVIFAAAGRTPGVATGTGIAAVATLGYFGFLAGPPMIGFVAHATSLTGGLGMVVILLVLITLLARYAGQADTPTLR